MDLMTMTPTARRLQLALCCGAPDTPMTETQRTAVRQRLADHAWVPTPEETPVPFEVVERWFEQGASRQQAAMALKACADVLDQAQPTEA